MRWAHILKENMMIRLGKHSLARHAVLLQRLREGPPDALFSVPIVWVWNFFPKLQPWHQTTVLKKWGKCLCFIFEITIFTGFYLIEQRIFCSKRETKCSDIYVSVSVVKAIERKSGRWCWCGLWNQNKNSSLRSQCFKMRPLFKRFSTTVLMIFTRVRRRWNLLQKREKFYFSSYLNGSSFQGFEVGVAAFACPWPLRVV